MGRDRPPPRNFAQNGFGQRDNNFDNERPLARSFIPKMRDINDIYRDDEERANVANDLFDTDCNVEVIGSSDHVQICE